MGFFDSVSGFLETAGEWSGQAAEIFKNVQQFTSSGSGQVSTGWIPPWWGGGIVTTLPPAPPPPPPSKSISTGAVMGEDFGATSSASASTLLVLALAGVALVLLVRK